MSDFTVVLGVDRRHLAELSWAMRTWTKHKPQIFKHPFLVFYDYKDLTHGEVFQTLQNASGDKIDLKTTRYPDRSLPDAVWDLGIKDRWHDPVRNRMLSGFVHVPAQMVETRYWLKLDTDTLAKDDQWFPQNLLESNAQIIAHPWGYTKPADQIEKLDTSTSGSVDSARASYSCGVNTSMLDSRCFHAFAYGKSHLLSAREQWLRLSLIGRSQRTHVKIMWPVEITSYHFEKPDRIPYLSRTLTACWITPEVVRCQAI